jgi:hypothetical protein
MQIQQYMKQCRVTCATDDTMATAAPIGTLALANPRGQSGPAHAPPTDPPHRFSDLGFAWLLAEASTTETCLWHG